MTQPDQQEQDVRRIAAWLTANVPTITTPAAAEQAAWLAIYGHKDRTKPIEHMLVRGYAFDIPAPSTLPDPPPVGE